MIFGHFWKCKKWNLPKKLFVKLIYLISRVFFYLDFLKFSGPLWHHQLFVYLFFVYIFTCLFTFSPSTESDADRELLLVLEGKISPKIESILLSLLQYDTFVLKNNGQLATKERKIRIVMETGEDLSALTPSLSKYFEFSRQKSLNTY